MRSPPARARSWRAAECGGLDLLHGTFTTHVYARHTHETYSIGLLGNGAMTFSCRGGSHTLRPGLIGVIHPGEVHTGHAGEGGGWTYHNLYPEAALLEGAIGEAGGRATPLPRLPVVIDDAPRSLKPGDVMMADGQGVVCTILYGQDGRTPISSSTRRALYVAYAPAGVPAATVGCQLDTILENVFLFAPGAEVEKVAVRAAGGPEAGGRPAR